MKINKRAKCSFLMCIGLLVFSFYSWSQVLNTPTYSSMNNTLRQMFGGLTPPAGSEKLYDMTVHLSDESFYREHKVKPNDQNNWMMMYEELYYASLDTNLFVPIKDVLDDVMLLPNDKVAILAFDFRYHKFKDSTVFNDTTYFLFDTVNNVLSDNPAAPGSPYVVEGVFGGMTSREYNRFTNVTFRMDPNFLFYDAVNSIDFTTYEFQVKFGDGTGWHTMQTTSVNDFVINYPSAGTYTIRYRIYDPENNIVINRSASKIRIEKSYPSLESDSTFTVGSLNVNVYDPCEDIPTYRRKAFIFLTGFDPIDEWSHADWFDMFIREGDLDEILDYGHQIFVVEYDANPTADIRTLGDDLGLLINEIKCNVIAEGDEQYTVLGYSMGGLVGRYGLLKMENTTPPPTACNAPRMHNTRLFISMDAPQFGANVPMSFQRIWYSINDLADALPPLAKLRHKLIAMPSTVLDRPATQQLLMLHASTGISTGVYLPHAKRNQLLNEMDAMGGYPSFCKNVAFSHGMLNGDKQVSNYTGIPLPDQFKFLDASVDVSVKILWWKVKILEGTTVVKSNPNYAGNFFTANIDAFKVKLKVKLFGIKLKAEPKIPIINISYSGTNLPPLCSHSGSYFEAPDMPSSDSHDWWNIGVNTGDNGKLGIGTSGGWQYTSESSRFCFIPTLSALDYGANIPGLTHNHDITSDVDPATETPFDLIIGCYAGAPDDWDQNRPHSIPFRNEVTGDHDNGILVREIGDDKIWLDNYDINWDMDISAYKELHVGAETNPGYWYAGQPWSSGTWIEGAYSDNNPVTVIPGYGNPVFTIDPSGSFVDMGIVGSYTQAIDNVVPCDEIGKRRVTVAANEDEVYLYPNPSNGRLSIEIGPSMDDERDVRFEIYDLSGRKLMEEEVAVSSGFVRSHDLSDYEAGVYNVNVVLKDRTITRKWIKK